jgi:hypothetical protein
MWTSKKRVKEIIEACLNEMYQNADPPITWDEYKKRYANTGIQGFKKHYLDEKKCNEIWKKYEKQVPRLHQTAFNFEILNFAPTGVKQNEQ